MNLQLTIQKEITPAFLDCNLGVRYWEDSQINGKDDDSLVPTMPLAYLEEGPNEWRWRIRINVDNGQIQDWPKGTTATIHYKVCDDGQYDLIGERGGVLFTCESYVPECLHSCEKRTTDYVIMDINEEGYIKDWRFGQEELDDLVNGAF